MNNIIKKWRRITSKKERRLGEHFFMRNNGEFVIKVYKGHDSIAFAIEELSEVIQQRANEIEDI